MEPLTRYTAIFLLTILLAAPTTVLAQEVDTQRILGSDFGTNATAASLRGSSSPPSACHITCTSLFNSLPSKVHYGPLSQSEPPDSFRNAYFTAQQREITPACIVQPRSAQDVAETVRIIAGTGNKNHDKDGVEDDNQCIFAIKSGGHAIFAGASNAPGGVTIDLRYLNEVTVSEDRETVALGPGNRWGEVYGALEPYGLTVTGGRDKSVGVGGFLLGGGISFNSRQYGWALDNIRNFEVVLGNGSIVEANPSSNPDLYYALRGGGSNFGIVTRFDMETHPRTPMWGGYKVYLLDDMDHRKEVMGISRRFEFTPTWFIQKAASGAKGLACQLGFCVSSENMVQAFDRITKSWDSDPLAQMIMAIIMLEKVNLWGIWVSQVYSKAEAEPAVFDEFNKMPSIYDTTRIANLSDLVEEMSSLNPAGARHLWNELTFQVNATLLSRLFDIFVAECDPMWKLDGVRAALDVMIISKGEIKQFSKNGGNALGLSDEKEPLLLVLIALYWNSAEQDVAVSVIAENLRTRFITLGKEMGLFHPYIYQNYAFKTADVFAGYGAESRARLRKIKSAYDPTGMFGDKMPGHFKV